MKIPFSKPAIALAALIMSAFSLSADNSMNCFTVIAGKNTTVDGSVMVAHNEDDWGEQMLNIYQVARGELGSNAKYLWLELPNMKVSDGFLNEYGVAVCSDGCPSRVSDGELTDGGVLYEVRTSAAQNARSAREAVSIIGDLIDKKGYSDSGRSYMVADSNEAWVVSIINGKHWVAQRVPDDKVMIIPNNYTIDEVNLDDTDNFAGSPDIKDYAQKNGWWNPKSEKFSFRKAFCNPGSFSHKDNIDRHSHALQIISGKKFGNDPNKFPFAVTPKKKIDRAILAEVLSCHYNKPGKHGQHPTGICVNETMFAAIFQLRSNLPVEIGAVAWIAAGRPCVENFLPWYCGMTKAPENFGRYSSASEAFKKHFTDVEGMQKKFPKCATWSFVDRWNFINKHYSDFSDEIGKYNKKYQKDLYKKQVKFEKSLTKFYDPATGKITDKSGLEQALNKHTADAYKRYFKQIKKENKQLKKSRENK